MFINHAHGQPAPPWGAGDVSAAALTSALAACRTSAQDGTSWVISGFGSGQTTLPPTLRPEQTSFLLSPFPDALDHTPVTFTAGEALTALLTQIAKAGCPIEVRGFASVEGASAQNIGLAQSRRDEIAQGLLSAGLPPASLTLGAIGVSQDYDDLAKNRRVEIYTRPDLAWHCRQLPNPEQLFPIHGLWRQGDPAALVQALAGQLASYPCQTTYHIWAKPEQHEQIKTALALALKTNIADLPSLAFYPTTHDQARIYLGIPSKAEGERWQQAPR